MKRKKSKRKNISKYKAINIRVNAKLLEQFNLVCSKKYNITTTSKGFRLVIDNVLNSDIDECKDDIVKRFSKTDLSSYPSDKKSSVNLDDKSIHNLGLLSNLLGIKASDCINKLLLLEVLSNIHMAPFKPKNMLDSKKHSNGYTKFNLRCNRNVFDNFISLYFDITGESNKTSALNDLIKRSIANFKGDSSTYLNEISKEKPSQTANDYKYNFTIANRRYVDYVNLCNSFGISPQECLRKSMIIYIKKNNSDSNS